MIGERTTEVALVAAKAASSTLLLARYPVISVNGNVAALCAKQIVELSNVTGAAIEVNLFYRTPEREIAIEKELKRNKAKAVLGVGIKASARIPGLQSQRKLVDPDGVYKADALLVPLEDGDRTEALVKMGKTVITIDLNPLSRTARAAHITIVDNIIRAIPEMIIAARQLRGEDRITMSKIIKEFDNKTSLAESLKIIQNGVGLT
jgi:4-phosphopantoate--beta-alanine ligase